MRSLYITKTSASCNTPVCPEYKKEQPFENGLVCSVCEIPMEVVRSYRFKVYLFAILVLSLFLINELVESRRIPAPTIKHRNSLSMSYVSAGEYIIPPHLKQYYRFIKTDRIVINQAFYIQDGEVTIGDYIEHIESLGNEDQDVFRGNMKMLQMKLEKSYNQPVEYISWQEANEYAVWLSNKTKWRLKLPTLNQWVAAGILYAKQKPVLVTEENQPESKLHNRVEHLIGNVREWSSDTCGEGTYRLLGENYMTTGKAVGQDNCAGNEKWIGVGIRLVRMDHY